MKKKWGILLLTGLFVGNLHASSFECFGTKGKLDLTFSPTHMGQDVYATLDMAEIGEKIILSGHKKHMSKLEDYILSTDNNLPAILKFSIINNHGGRCGRCTQEPTIEYYAKLALNSQVLDFQCHLKAF